PATRRFARQQGVDLASVPGTGPRGRISREDVERFQQGGAPIARAQTEPAIPSAMRTEPAAPATARRPEPAPTSIAPSEGDVRIPFRGMRKRIAENMSRAKNTAAHFTYVEEIDTTDLVAVRDRAK